MSDDFPYDLGFVPPDIQVEVSKTYLYDEYDEDGVGQGKPIGYQWVISGTRRPAEYGIAVSVTPEFLIRGHDPVGLIVAQARDALDRYELETFGQVLTGTAFQRKHPDLEYEEPIV